MSADAEHALRLVRDDLHEVADDLAALTADGRPSGAAADRLLELVGAIADQMERVLDVLFPEPADAHARAMAEGLEDLSGEIREHPVLAPVVSDHQIVYRCTDPADWRAMALALGGRLETLEWGAAAQVSRRFGGLEVAVYGCGISDDVLDEVESAGTSPAPVSAVGEGQ